MEKNNSNIFGYQQIPTRLPAPGEPMEKVPVRHILNFEQFDEHGVSGTPETGYFKDPRAQGLKTGRRSPRIPIRQPIRDRVDVARGLVNPGDVDPNQGVLFHPSEIAVTPLEDLAKKEGIPLLRPSSGRGFLPGITASPTGEVSSTTRKINAIRKFTAALTIPNKSIAGSREHAMGYMSGTAPEPGESWYADKAADAIVQATVIADRRAKEATKEPSHINAAQMRKGVAYFSAQRPWDVGNAQEGTHRIANVENVIDLPTHVLQGKDPRDYTVQAVSGGHPVHGERVKPQIGDVQEKAANVFSGDVHPSAPHTSEKDKVATFDSALSVGMTDSVPLKRHLHNATVIDTHSSRVVGLPNYDHIANTDTGYAVAAFVTRRASQKAAAQAMKLGLTPSTPLEDQEGSWAKIRPSESMGMMSLFTEDKKTGELKPNDFEKVKRWNEKITQQETVGRPQKTTKKTTTKKTTNKRSTPKKK